MNQTRKRKGSIEKMENSNFLFKDQNVTLIKSKAIPYKHPSNIFSETDDELLKKVENIGRVCYKSEDKINSESSEKFFKTLLNNKHLSVLEHANLIWSLNIRDENFKNNLIPAIDSVLNLTNKSQYFVYGFNMDKEFIIASNLRAVYEFLFTLRGILNSHSFFSKTDKEIFSKIILVYFFMDFIFAEKYEKLYEMISKEIDSEFGLYDMIRDYVLCECNDIYNNIMQDCVLRREGAFKTVSLVDYDETSSKNVKCIRNGIDYTRDLSLYTFKIITNRGITHEIVRSRTLSFTQESTRYVNYDKKCGFKYTNIFDKLDNINLDIVNEYNEFIDGCSNFYSKLVNSNVPPQYARDILPHSLKAEIICSGRIGCPELYDENSKIPFVPLYSSIYSSGWGQFLILRLSQAAHPEIRKIAEEIKEYFITIGVFKK